MSYDKSANRHFGSSVSTIRPVELTFTFPSAYLASVYVVSVIARSRLANQANSVAFARRILSILNAGL